ncbi:MAG: glutathione synthase, partial [Rhizorhabdus sp.]|nr:glutathione synthase [Rhizorhabdus sp.]
MPLNVAVQMDPLETINIAGDSTFAVMLGALARGHRLWHYSAGDLCYRDGRLTAPARPITKLQRVKGDHFEAGDVKVIDLVDDIDVVLMRQDPPF